MAKYDDVPLYMQSPERLQQFRRESEQALQRRTEQQNMEETLQFRNAFEEQAFDMKRDTLGMHLQSPKTAVTSKNKSKREWDLMVHLISNWDSGADGLSKRDFRTKHIDRHKNWTQYYVTFNNLGSPSLWYKHASTGKNKRVVNIEQVFDVIHTYHLKVGHQGIFPTYLSIGDSYYNITRREVKLFVNLCPICNEKQPKVKPFKGAAKPIESFRFRDRFQGDLIDYQTDPRHLYPYDDKDKGPVMKWLFVMKDHFSRLVYAVPLPSKSPQHVARELRHIFSVLGYPLIWHTDNGKEFGQAVIDAVKEYNPLAYTLTGACRTPRHQGSVENANGGVKAIIGSMIADKKLILRDRPNLSKAQQRRLEDVSWVTEYPNAVQSLNSAIRSGKNEVEPYSLVFGMRYEDPMMSGLYVNPESKQHTSIPERAAFLGGDYESKMKMMLELPDDYDYPVNTNTDDDNNVDHDSVKTNLFGLNSDNVDYMQSCNEANVIDNSTAELLAQPAEDCKPAAALPESPIKRFQSNLKSPPGYEPSPSSPPDDYPSDSPSALATLAWCQEICEQEMEDKTVFQVKTEVVKQSSAVLSSLVPISLEKAFLIANNKKKRNKGDVVIVLPSLWCIQCFCMKSPPFALISAFTPNYLGTLKTSTDWFRTDFIAAFCRLIAHEYHSSEIMLLDCLYPNQIITSNNCVAVPVGVKKLMVCSNASSHFGLLVFDLDGSKSVTIFDGSNYPNSNWKDHCLWALRITSLVDIDTSSRKCLNFVTPGTPFKQPSGKQDDDKWAVRISPKSLKQRDGYNCGPIVCLHAWEVLSCGTFSAENLEYKRYRETVVNKYSSLLCKFSSSLLIRNTPDFIDLACDDNVKAPSMLKLNCTDDVNEVEENKESENYSLSLDGSCQICFCDVEQEFLTLDCCHQEVHKHCIVHWASTGIACPWCRSSLPEEIMTMGQKRTLPVSSQTLHSVTEAMPNFMRSVNPFGRRIHIHTDELDSVLEEDTDEDKETPTISGSKGASTNFDVASHGSVARKPLYSSSSSSETDNDSLLNHNPFRRNIRQNVLNEVRSQQKQSPMKMKRASSAVLWPHIDAKRRRSENNTPEVKPVTPAQITPAQNPTTEDLVRQVHDELKGEGESVGKINALEESAKKRRNRMLHEASGRMRQDAQAKKMKAMYTKNLPDVNPGDAVTLKLKPNQRANGHRGILGIVVEVSNNNTIRVVTEHGIISGSRDRDFWFSPDLYKVHQPNAPVWGKLVALQSTIRKKTFVHETIPRLILSSCHQKIYGGQVGRAKCGCKKGCNAACSCRKSSLPCGSNCKCMANCEYAKNYQAENPPENKKKSLVTERSKQTESAKKKKPPPKVKAKDFFKNQKKVSRKKPPSK
jgi:hypothetical protein